jgi:NUDIX domain
MEKVLDESKEVKVVINKKKLIELIKNAQFRIRILGAISFDLPYEEFKYDWLERINNGELQVEIICESESYIQYSSIISSNRRVSGENRSYDVGTFLNKQIEPQKKIRDFLYDNDCLHIEPEEEAFKEFLKAQTEEHKSKILQDKTNGQFDMLPFKQFFSLRTCYLNIPIPVINIDDDYYITQSLTLFCNHDKFEKITKENIWLDEYHRYFNAYFDSPLGAKKHSSEITKKDNRTEVILMYNDKRQVLGQLPRDSFLGSTKVKVVIWGMLFSRDGRVLIHRRGKNAKDNQGLWDKSIGGHVDLEKDVIDTVKAAAREMLEELFKVEQAEQSGHTKVENMEVNENKPIFLGEWRPEMRYTFPFSEIKSKKEEYFFFRMNYNFSKQVVDSPRLLPNGKEMPVKVFADVYVFVMPEDFTTIDLKNSKYLLLEMYELNDSYLDGEIFFDGEWVSFDTTPDLKKIITGDLWTELNSFADYLKDGNNIT